MRKPIKTEIVWFRQFGGVRQASFPEHLIPGQLHDALNYEITDIDEYSPREGFKRRTDNLAPDGLAIETIFPADFDGVIYNLISTASHVYHLTDAGTWTLLYTIASAGEKMVFTMTNQAAAPIVVWGNGKIHPQKWDLSTVSDIGGGTDAPHGRPFMFKGYLGMFNIDGEPGRVRIAANPSDPDTWLDLGGNEKFLETVGAITSVIEYAGGLLVMTRTRAEFYTGDPDQLTSMQILSTSIGCGAHETVIDCDGVLVWLSHSGVVMWAGGGNFPTRNLSSPEDVTASNITTDMKNFYWANTRTVSAAYLSLKKRYFISGKIQIVAGGTTYWRTWVYSFRKATWMPWDLQATALARLVNSASDYREELLVCRSDGAVCDQYLGNFVDQAATDAGNTNYTYWFKMGAMDMGAPNDQKIFRAIWFSSKALVGDGSVGGIRTITLTVYGELSSVSHETVNQSISATGGSFILGVSKLGVGTLGLTDFFESFQRFSLRAKHIQFKVSGSGNGNAVAIGAFAIEYRPGVRREYLVPS